MATLHLLNLARYFKSHMKAHSGVEIGMNAGGSYPYLTVPMPMHEVLDSMIGMSASGIPAMLGTTG